MCIGRRALRKSGTGIPCIDFAKGEATLAALSLKDQFCPNTVCLANKPFVPSLSKDSLRFRKPFDKLSANGFFPKSIGFYTATRLVNDLEFALGLPSLAPALSGLLSQQSVITVNSLKNK
jgi:hypothetical protein